jgi:hypothetical protein
MQGDTTTILENHEKRITELEARFESPKPTLPIKDKKSLNDHILNLREEGFFAEPRIPEQVYAALQQSYHCERNRVAVALLRLADRRELRRTSIDVSGKKYVGYVS